METTIKKEYGTKEKEKIQGLFNQIAPKYDFLNHLLSFSLDKKWRKKVVKLLPKKKKVEILDVSTGTGDMAIAMALYNNQAKITGIDIAQQMLEIGKQKLAKRQLTDRIELHLADAENIPFDSNSFDYCMVAFGVRNFEHTSKGLDEMHRILKPGGKLIILEFSNPRSFPFKHLYAFYSKTMLPLIGRMVSSHKAAYSYLPQSAKAFPCGNAFLQLLSESRFIDGAAKTLTFGIVTIYESTKPSE